MGLEELFDMDNRRDRQGRDNRYRQEDNDHNDDHYRQNEYSQSYGHQSDIKQQILDKLRGNPQLKTLIIVGAIIIVIILIVAAIFLIPLILKLFGFVSDNGIQGVINAIWKGAK
jgi:hypothetical protein